MMHTMNYWAVALAAVASLILGALWYSPLVLGNAYMRLSSLHPRPGAEMKMPPWKLGVEFVRGLVVAGVLARLVMRLGVVDWMPAAHLAAMLWIAFPVTLLVGSVIHQSVPWKLAAIHAGDWLVKLLVMTIIVGVWR